MYRSISYVSQGSQSAFVEMAQRSAEVTRLFQEARVSQPERRSTQMQAAARRMARRVGHLLVGLGGTTTRGGAEAPG
jgi:hypothetical protein